MLKSLRVACGVCVCWCEEESIEWCQVTGIGKRERGKGRGTRKEEGGHTENEVMDEKEKRGKKRNKKGCNRMRATTGSPPSPHPPHLVGVASPVTYRALPLANITNPHELRKF